jgi:hypothetical protein
MSKQMDRWFWIYLGNMVLSALVTLLFLSAPSRAASNLDFTQPDEPGEFTPPEAVPAGFQGFDHDVPAVSDSDDETDTVKAPQPDSDLHAIELIEDSLTSS